MPEETTFIKLKANKKQLCFYGLANYNTPPKVKKFHLLKTPNELNSIIKKAYLGSCKIEEENLYLFEILE